MSSTINKHTFLTIFDIDTMNYKFKFILLIFIFLAFHVKAEQYLILLKDKGNCFHTYSYFFSKISLDKKAKRGIELDEKDLPLSEKYLEVISKLNGNILAKSKWINTILVECNSTNANQISNLPFVVSVKPAYSSKSVLAEINQNYPPQASSNWQAKMLQLDELHNNGYTGKGITIAVFDNGFTNIDKNSAFTHLFKHNRIIANRNFVNPSLSVFRTGSDGEHGARVLSIISAIYPPQMVGTAYDANLILAATEDMRKEGILEEFNWLNAAEWADSIGTDIISSSLGYAIGFSYGEDYRYEELDGKTTIIAQAAAIASRKGILVINSAGNEGNNSWKHIISPADADSVLAIGAVDVYKNYSSYSSQGPRTDNTIKPDISAMGTQCLTVMTDGSLKTGNGTSFACPMISGMSACIWQSNENAKNMDLFSSIKKNASLADKPNNYLGWGIPNATKSLEEISGKQLINLPNHQNRLNITPNPVENDFSIVYMNYYDLKKFYLELYNSNGAILQNIELEMENGYNEFYFNIKTLGLKPGIFYLQLREPRGNMLEEKKLLVIP